MKFITSYKSYFFLVCLIIFAFFLRISDINWDSGAHLHPDERAIVLFTLPLHFPSSLAEFFSPQSPLNPHFFAYGSFPLYFLKVFSLLAGKFDPLFLGYDKINLLGRFFSALFDSATVALLFFLGRKLRNKTVGFCTAFFYATCVLPIQLSHFYAVDTMLTFFILATLFSLITLYENPSLFRAIPVGILFGLSLATKISAIAVAASIGTALIIDFLLIFLRSPHKPRVWFPHIPHVLKKLFTEGVLTVLVAGITFCICEPYALIDTASFWAQNMQQAAMTKDAFTFPYTLQYVGKVPYWYEIKNIFLFGQGPILATLAFFGAVYFSYQAIKKEKHIPWAHELILVVFFWSYFAVVGKFAIGFMRYTLPIYPLLCLFAAIVLVKIFSYIKIHTISTTIAIAFFLLLLVWPLSFLAIYTKPNTRVAATAWINQTIPRGSTLAIEHWDDSLPLTGQEKFHMQTLELYNIDTPEKWEKINGQIEQSDYIILASNRLYVPLQKLTNCQKLLPHPCYTQTAKYYKNLFSGDNVIVNFFQDEQGNKTQLGSNPPARFVKVAEFAVYPTIPLLNIPINDQGADESFTVYDHPKVMIFKKM